MVIDNDYVLYSK